MVNWIFNQEIMKKNISFMLKKNTMIRFDFVSDIILQLETDLVQMEQNNARHPNAVIQSSLVVPAFPIHIKFMVYY